MTPQDEHNLERLVDRAFRDLPPRTAPRSLEARVQAELARRAALPWWRKSYVDWPLAARGIFALAALAIVKVVLMAAVWAQTGFNVSRVKTLFASEIQVIQGAGALLHSAADVVVLVLNRIPPLWLYGGAATILALYVALFGLGAAAYRTLQANSN